MCCLYDIKTNLHNSTASEAGLFFKAYLKVEALERSEKLPDYFLMGRTAHKGYQASSKVANTSVWATPAEEQWCVSKVALVQLKQGFALLGSHCNVVNFKFKCKHVNLYF